MLNSHRFEPGKKSVNLSLKPFPENANEMFFFIAEFERAAKIRKIAFYRFLISLLDPEL